LTLADIIELTRPKISPNAMILLLYSNIQIPTRLKSLATRIASGCFYFNHFNPGLRFGLQL